MDLIYSRLQKNFFGLFEKFGLSSLTYVAQVFLLSLTAGDLLTALLKALNFSYWRYFLSFKYLLILGGLWLYYHMGIHFGGYSWINTILFYACVIHIFMYLVDFAWYRGQQHYDSQPQTSKIIEIGALSIIASLLGAKTITFSASQLPFMLYIGLILAVSLLCRKSRLAQGLIVVIFALLERFLVTYSKDNFKLSLVFHVIMLLIAFDRQGKEAGVLLLSEKQYPASTYLFKATSWMYLYFILTGETSHAEYVIGAIFFETMIVAYI